MRCSTKRTESKHTFAPHAPVFQLKFEPGERVPTCKQSFPVISTSLHTDYVTPQEPSIQTWNHFYETRAHIMQTHLEDQGTIEFEPEFSNDWRAYEFSELVSLQAQAAGGLLLTAPAGTGKTLSGETGSRTPEVCWS